MTTNNTNKKKKSTARKLIPAAGMLMVSAAMLASSTYAWFTMSREVEVNNIRMTATVPEDIQLSLGHLVGFAGDDQGDALVSNASSYTGLAGNQGKLDKANGAANADDGNVKAPYNNGRDAVTALDWSSSADISEYYRLGKIIPASSIDGQNIYFTPDAAGVGKTLKVGARYYQAANISGAFTWDDTNKEYATSGGGDSAMTKLHAINNVTESSDLWNSGQNGDTYVTATEFNVTNDDGYFVDIPIWFRSSAQSELTLAVDAYVTTTQAKDEDDLYLAARAVVLYNATAEDSGENQGGYAGAPAATTNLLRVRKDNFTDTDTENSKVSIVDYMYSTNATGDAVNSTAGAYADAVEYTGSRFLKVAAGANNTYGPMTKAIVRVWLEGEDPNCWNSNAGQDFAISLKFTKDNLSATQDATGDTPLNTYPASAIVHNAATANGTYDAAGTGTSSLVAGARVKVTSTTTVDGTAKVDNLEFEFNGTKWSLVTDGSFHKYEGFTYSYGSNTDIQNSDDIAEQLLTQITTKNAADTAYATPITITGTAIGG